MSLTALAPQPARATSSVTLAFGLVSLPLSVYTGVESTRVARKEFFQGDTNIPVGRSPVRKDTGAVIETDDVVRMAEADSGAWVALSDEEIADATSAVKGQAEVSTFVPLKDVGNYLTEGVVQLRPKRTKGQADPAVTRAFALVLAAMGKNKVAALVKVAMRGPARYGLLLPTGDMLLVLTADAVRQSIPVDDGFKFTKAELDLAGQLIAAVGIDAPVLTDTTAPAVQAFVNAKAAGVPAPAAPAAPAIPANIMDALTASIDAAKAKKVA